MKMQLPEKATQLPKFFFYRQCKKIRHMPYGQGNVNMDALPVSNVVLIFV
jgi:hypothetical protein